VKVRTLHGARRHYGWDPALEPALRVAPGEMLELEVVEASDGQIHPGSTVEDVRRLDPSRANPVTGPIHVEGSEPGDGLTVEILDFQPSGWGWTAILPGFGLLADEFPRAYLHLSRHDSRSVEFASGIHLPLRPFPGTLGVAPAEPGPHDVIPPRDVGGNMDVRHLVRGTRAHLPVRVRGALLSLGDTHAAQGDGEVCGTAIESPMKVLLRVGVDRGEAPRRPWFEIPGTGETDEGPRIATTGIASDLMEAARDAVRDMIDHLGSEHGLAPELAYCLCSAAVDLRISECVNRPSWLVTAHLPRDIFD
jgi:acetamidase/formamidase